MIKNFSQKDIDELMKRFNSSDFEETTSYKPMYAMCLGCNNEMEGNCWLCNEGFFFDEDSVYCADGNHLHSYCWEEFKYTEIKKREEYEKSPEFLEKKRREEHLKKIKRLTEFGVTV